MVIIEILSRLEEKKQKSLNANLIIIKPKIYYLLLEEEKEKAFVRSNMDTIVFRCYSNHKCLFGKDMH